MRNIKASNGEYLKVDDTVEYVVIGNKVYGFYRRVLEDYLNRKDRCDLAVAYRIPDYRPLPEGFDYSRLEEK